MKEVILNPSGIVYFLERQKIPTSKKILMKELKRLSSGEGNTDEANLLKDFGFVPRLDYVRMTKSDRQDEATRRLTILLEEFMPRSLNEDFREKAEYIKDIQRDGDLDIRLHDHFSNVKGAKMGIDALLAEDGLLKLQLSISKGSLINNYTVRAACDLVHEAEHIRRIILFYSALPENLSEAKKIRAINDWMKTDQVEEESRAYAKDLTAYIKEVALVPDYISLARGGLLDRASVLIQSSYDPLNRKWQEKIRNFLIETKALSKP